MAGYPCPCCGFLTRVSKEYGTFRICPICYWEDDDEQAANPDLDSLANDASLNEARENFKMSGASEEEFLALVRKPLPHEAP